MLWPQSLLPSWWRCCLVHTSVVDRFDFVLIPDQLTPRSHFATYVSHFIDIFICIHKSLHFQFSTLSQHITPHFSMCERVSSSIVHSLRFFKRSQWPDGSSSSTESHGVISGRRVILCESALSTYFPYFPYCPYLPYLQ